MEPDELQIRCGEVGEKLRHLFGIHTELLRAAAHPHTRPLHLEVGIHPHRDPRAHTQHLAGSDHPPGLRRRFHLDRHPCRDGLHDLRRRSCPARRN